MTQRRNPNEGSTDLPNYLRVSTERHKSSSPSGRSSKKVFPQLRHGVSPDAPIEFHNKNSILALSSAKSILLEDPAIKHEKPKKVLGKDKLVEWPMKYIYTTALDIEHIPHKIERKSVKPKELYDCILNESRVVQRPDMVTGEETLYTRRFYEAVRESKAFHRKKGYFENFANHHKTTTEDYKVRRSSSNGHTRYINKPVILTNLNSRNSMTSNGSQLHSSLLHDTQGKRPTLTPLVSEQSINKSHIDEKSASAKVQSHTQTLTQNQNDTLQLQHTLSKKAEASEKNSGSFMTHKHFYENYSKKGSTQQTPDFERTTRQSDAENSRLNTRRVKTIKRTRSIVADKPTENSYAKSSRRDVSADYTLKVDQTQSFQTGHNSIRYKTKDITRLLSEQREQGIHVDPTVFVQHKVDVENKRDSDIRISVIDQRKRYSLATNGSPVKYICASYRGPTNGEEETAEDTVGGNIAKFEKYIDRLRFTGKNFGHQRWFYDRNWKLEKHNAAL